MYKVTVPRYASPLGGGGHLTGVGVNHVFVAQISLPPNDLFCHVTWTGQRKRLPQCNQPNNARTETTKLID